MAKIDVDITEKVASVDELRKPGSLGEELLEAGGTATMRFTFAEVTVTVDNITNETLFDGQTFVDACWDLVRVVYGFDESDN